MVHTSTGQPAASTRRTSFSVSSHAAGMYSWYHSPPARAAITSSTPVEVMVDSTCSAFFALAARAVATSPSAWNMRRPPTGHTKIGLANRWPNSSTLVSIFETSTRRCGRSWMFLYAAALACSVRLSSVPLAM